MVGDKTTTATAKPTNQFRTYPSCPVAPSPEFGQQPLFQGRNRQYSFVFNSGDLSAGFPIVVLKIFFPLCPYVTALVRFSWYILFNYKLIPAIIVNAKIAQ